jgi:hypothetical protein
MGRWAAVRLVACIGASASTAVADPEPQPTPAPAGVSWYGTATNPATAPATPDRIRHRVLRGGAFFLGGFSYVAVPYARLDLGVPTPANRFPRLRTTLISELGGGTDSDQTRRRVLVLTPTLQYDWHLPFPAKRGEVLLITAAGLRRNELWVKKPEEPFWPSKWESTTAYAVKLTAGVEYRAFSGLVVSFQPSIGLPLNDPKPPDARWMAVAAERDYGASLVAGYQLQ